MEKQISNVKTQSVLDQLIANAFRHIEELGYRPSTLSHYRRTWNALLRYSRQDQVSEEFSENLINGFLSSCDILVGEHAKALSPQKRHICAAMRVLAEFFQHGYFQRRRCTGKKVQLPAMFQKALHGYKNFCKDHLDHGPSTLHLRMRNLKVFLHFLDEQGLQSFVSLSPALLSQFISSRSNLKPATLATFVSAIRSFLRYLCIEGSVLEDLSGHVPKVRICRDEQIPSVWTPEEVDALFTAVDRDSPQGKRDYAILLLAYRLGLRAGDIRNLRFEHLLWNESRIEISQSKTGEVLTLPMSEEIGFALIDYLQHGRPVTPCREVFIRLIAPFEPFADNDNLHSIITLYRRRAGIGINTFIRNRRGMHSLRHTLASRLLETGTPMETISNILGHRSTESTRIYTKVNIDGLRSAALDPEEVSHA